MSGAPTVAIIGRPNVGKSTLFNRLIGRRDAIVDAQPGVTRDRHFGAAEWNGRRFWLVDTGGMVLGAEDALNRAIRTQVEMAVAESDVINRLPLLALERIPISIRIGASQGQSPSDIRPFRECPNNSRGDRALAQSPAPRRLDNDNASTSTNWLPCRL